MVSFLFPWLLLFQLCTIKTNFLQYTWELQKFKSKYFTGKKIQENPADHLRSCCSAYSGSFYWPRVVRNALMITVMSLWHRDQTGNKAR